MQDPKSRQNRHLGTIPQICRAISSQLRYVSTIGKNLLNSNISSTCPHNMVNFGPLAAEILSLVWGSPGNFNGFRVLAALLYGTLVVGVSQTAAFNRGRHLYSARRPSRWALAHISSFVNFQSSFLQLICPWSGVSPKLGFRCRRIIVDLAPSASHLPCRQIMFLPSKLPFAWDIWTFM